MNNCLNCGSIVKNKYCNVSCQNKHMGYIRSDKKYGIINEFNVKCNICGNNIIVKEREKLFPKKENYYCSKSCANTRKHSKEIKIKISESMKKNSKKKSIVILFECGFCKKEFIKKHKKQMFCSRSCSSKSKNYLNPEIGRKGGIASAKARQKRSKNEIYFSDLCKKHFENVLTNKTIFNGWDADVIIEKIKFAILWNGRWHYEKITKKHSLLQVQNRDKIKINEIKKYGYTPYVIKDLGKENKVFVENEFKKFIEFLKENNFL